MFALFLFHFLKSEEAAIDPSLLLPEQSMDCFDGVYFGIGIWKIAHVVFLLVDTHAQDSILCEEDVLIV